MKKERPQNQGLYRREFEHENCGIGFVAHLKGKKSHSIIKQGLDILANMTHRGAEGADSAFERGCDEGKGLKEIYLPWAGFSKNSSKLFNPSENAYQIASETHPYFSSLVESVRLLMARNTHQVLGQDTASPSCLVICWTPDAADNVKIKVTSKSGGTGQALRLAQLHKISVQNLCNEKIKILWENWLENLSS